MKLARGHSLYHKVPNLVICRMEFKAYNKLKLLQIYSVYKTLEINRRATERGLLTIFLGSTGKRYDNAATDGADDVN
jgi:hypothetical protein